MSDPHFKQQVDLIVSHFNRGALSEVITCAERFSVSFPNHSFGWRAMGAAQKKMGHLDEAITCMQRALQIDPNDLEALQNIAITYRALHRFDLAELHVRRALTLKPASALLHRELGDTLLERGRLVEAEISHRQSLAIDARQPRVHANLAVALQQQGKIEEAITACEHALRLDPNLWVAWNNLLMSSQYATHVDVDSYRSRSATFGRLLSAVAAGQRNTRWRCVAGEKLLRVGFVSADLYSHPVGFFFQSMLEAAHKRSADDIECYVYSATPFADDVTQALKRHSAQWRDVFHLDPTKIANQIVEDGIHVLIDLSGHSAGNQLAVFAQKPAPVCVSWLGYFASTGMPEMDYVITDPESVLPEMKDQFCEQLLHMPKTRLCFTAPSPEVEVGALPAQRNGYITFGTFQNIAKINDDTLKAWARVMQAVDRSKFRMQFAALGDPAVRAMFESRLIKAGIDLTRVELIASVSRSQYLAAHNEIDMLLDTFPFPGGTTTCEALWMGLPTLTLGGRTMISQQGVSLLACVGLNEWIVQTVDDYVAAAEKFAGDVNHLAALRAQLRAVVTASPLFDSKTFASDFAALLRRAWQETGAKRVERTLA